MKRPLCLIAAGFVLGEAAVMLHLTMELAGTVLVAGAVFALGIRRSKEAVWLLVLLLFCGIGLGRGSCWERSLAAWEKQLGQLEEEFLTLEGTVSVLSREDGKLKLTLKDCEVITKAEEMGQGLLMNVMVTMAEEDMDGGGNLPIGAPVRIKGRLKSISQARNPGEFDYRSYYYAMGNGCRMDGTAGTVTGTAYEPLPDTLYRLRSAAADLINRMAEPEDAGIFGAAILGDKSALDASVRDLYQRNGIAHLLAISGLHLSIIGMGMYRIMRKTGLGYGAAGVAGACFVAAYGMLTGGAPSIVRAALMMSAGFLASYLGRSYDLLSAMSAAAVILLWQYPGQLAQGGFQLSFGAIAAIGVLLPVLEGWIGTRRGLTGGLMASISVQFMTLPIILYHFYQFPLYGILLNLIVIPLMTFVICSGLSGIILGACSAWAGIAALGPGHYILAFYQWLCSLVSSLPYSNIVMGRPSLGRICLYYIILFATLAFMRRKTIQMEKLAVQMEETSGRAQELKPSMGKEKRNRTEVWNHMLVRAFLVIFLGAGVTVSLRPLPDSGMEVLWMDVGQGDGCLIRTGGQTVLIDGGSTSEKSLGQYRLEPCVKSYGISRIDYVFVSHGDLDHISGVLYLLEKSRDITIGHLMLPYLGDQDPGIQTLKKLARERGISLSDVRAGDVCQIGEAKLTCIYPSVNDTADDANEESTVLKLDYGNCHILFTGDMSALGEHKLLERVLQEKERLMTPSPLQDIQILKTAHHGSKYSSSDAFLDAMGIRWAVLSYGEKNSYGHPHKEVMERMEKRQVHLWETARTGAVRLYTDGNTVKWERFLPEIR